MVCAALLDEESIYIYVYIYIYARDLAAARRLRHLRRQIAGGGHRLHRRYRRLRQGHSSQSDAVGVLVDGGAPGMARQIRAGTFQSRRRRRSVASRATAEGWTRVRSPIDEILQIFAWAAADIEYANTDAANELLNAQSFHF